MNTTVYRTNSAVCEDIRFPFWLSKWLFVQQLWSTISKNRRRMVEDANLQSAEPVSWPLVHVLPNPLIYSMLPPFGRAEALHCHYASANNNNKDDWRTFVSWPVALCSRWRWRRVLDQHQPKTKNRLPLFRSKSSTRPETNSGCHQQLFLTVGQIASTTRHLCHLLSDRLRTQCPFLVITNQTLPWRHFPEGIYCYIDILL